MLVLSRKKQQSVLFPNLGISVEILRVKGNAVRVGIDAPKDVNILRGELADDDAIRSASAAERKQRHDFRNRLNTANLALYTLKKQLELGRTEDAQKTLDKALELFAELEFQVGTKAASPTATVTDKMPRALVVEDNENERELLTGYLRLCGYEVESVNNGLDAMTFLATHHMPDVVLLDMNMPGMNGPETVSAIRCDSRYRDIKLFAVSGSEPQEVDVTIGRRGVDRWFAKPLKPDEFASELQAELNHDCVVA